MSDIESLSDNVDARIAVVDNASPDDSMSTLQRYVDEQSSCNLCLLQAKHNGGYAAGNNIGIRYALEHWQPQLVWVLNNDIIVRQGALNALVTSAQQQSNISIWGTTILKAGTSKLQCAAGCFYHMPTSMYFSAFAGKDLAQIADLTVNKRLLNYICGASMCIRADVFEQIGLLNEQYFLYFEELDFVRRLPQGASLGWCKNAIVEHVGGATIESATDTTADYYSNRSALLFTQRYHPRWLVFMSGFRFVAKGMMYLCKGNVNSFNVMSKAYRDFFRARHASKMG
jgi:GT2 family glycosyltransferase